MEDITHLKNKLTKTTETTQQKEHLHFLHIGKTGGTAIVYALNESNCCAQSPRRARMKAPDIYKLNPLAENSSLIIYIHAHNESLRDVPAGEKFFFFLRDPISRFTSGFYSRQRHGQPRYNAAWSPDEEIAFGRFSTTNQLALALSSTDTNEKAMAEKAMRSIPHVKDSYWKWFENEEYLKSRLADLFFIGFQENLAQSFEVLKTKLGLPAALQLPVDAILAHKNPAALDKKLEAQAIENLKKWYKDDYQFLDFCKKMVHPSVFTNQ